MGRPSLVAQRTAEILDAFERCVARFGMEGSSLEVIAAEAGMKRSILRHYVGNREQLVHALAERVIEKYDRMLADHRAQASHLPPVEQLMSYLFPATTVSTAESLLVLEALIAASAGSVEIRTRMQGWIHRLVDWSADLLRQAYPAIPRRQCWSVGYGVISICFNHESLTPLELGPRYHRAAKAAAMALVHTLDSESQGQA